jgi:Leucine-rich repeat (LRR) protein
LALERVDKALSTVDDPPKYERMVRGVQTIRARGCEIKSIEVVRSFFNLLELNISNNKELQSLRGLEKCLQLRNLDCKGGDLQNIDELMALRKLEHLNLKGNGKLKDLNGLDGHT